MSNGSSSARTRTSTTRLVPLILAPYTGWEIYVSDFEKWQPPADLDLYDLACCAQAWHWLAPDVRFHRAHDLLRPGGWLALWWNRADERGPIGHKIDAIYNEFAPEMTSRSMVATGDGPPSDEVPTGLAFAQPVRKLYRWAKQYTADEWVSLLRTQSDHRLLPPTQLEALLSRVHQVILDHGGSYLHNYVCSLWAAQKQMGA